MDFAAAVRKAPGSALEGSPTAPRKESPKPRPAKQQAAASSSSSSSIREDANGYEHDSAADKLKAESVLVGFEVFVPEPEKDSLSTSTEKEEEDEEAVREEADAADAAEAEEAQENAASPDAPKVQAKNASDRFFAPSQVGRRPRSVELGAILLKKADDRAFEVRGGLRFFNKADVNAKNQAPQVIAELNLDTINQSYRYVQSLIDLLKGQTPSQIASGHNSFVQLSRIGDFVKVTRTYKDDGDRKVEHVFKFESFAIQVREQAKQYAKAAAAVYQTVSRGKEQDKRAKSVQDKLMIAQFENAANTLKDLFSTTTVLPRLADKFRKQQENKNKSKKMNESDIRDFRKVITDRVGRAFMEKDPASMIPSEEDDYIVSTPAPAPVEAPKPVQAPKPQSQPKNAQGSSSSTATAPVDAAAARKEKQSKEQGLAGLKFSSNPYDIGNFGQNDLAKIEDTETVRQLAQAESAKKPPVKAKKAKPQKQAEQQKPAQQKPAQAAQPAAAVAAPVAAAAEKKPAQETKKAPAQEQPKKKEKQQEQPKKVQEPKRVEPVQEQPKPKAEQKKERKPQLNAEERAKAKVAHEQGEKETGKKVAQKLKSKQPAAQNSQDLVLYGGVAVGVLVVLYLLFTYGLPMIQASN